MSQFSILEYQVFKPFFIKQMTLEIVNSLFTPEQI